MVAGTTKISCPECGLVHRLPSGKSGRVTCKRCGASFQADTRIGTTAAQDIESFLIHVFRPLSVLVTVPFAFFKAPFSFYKYVQQSARPSTAISFFIQTLLLRIALVAVFFNEYIAPKSEFGADMARHFSILAYPIIDLIVVIWNFILVIATAFPAINFIAERSDNRRAGQELRSLIIYLVGISGLISMAINTAFLLTGHYLSKEVTLIIGVFFITFFISVFYENVKSIATGASRLRIIGGGLAWMIVYLLVYFVASLISGYFI